MEKYQNWQEEMRSAYLYGVMAQYENNILHKKLFSDLKTAAEKQAKMWEEHLKKQGIQPPSHYTPDIRTRIVAWLVKMLGVHNLQSVLSAMKIRGMSVFSFQHNEHKHITLSSANNLRAAIFGINDGLVSNMSLILGMAGGNATPEIILLAGAAGVLAGACSMGAGEYISVRSQREVYEYQIEIEKQELAEYPEEEEQELSLIYQARGIPIEDANKLAKFMVNNPETGLDVLAREELGLNPDELVSPVGAMLASFFAFAIGALLPLLPFIIRHHGSNLWISMVITAVALFVTGTILSLFTNRPPIWLGLRMLAVGAIAGAFTFFIGRLLGVAMF